MSAVWVLWRVSVLFLDHRELVNFGWSPGLEVKEPKIATTPCPAVWLMASAAATGLQLPIARSELSATPDGVVASRSRRAPHAQGGHSHQPGLLGAEEAG